MQSVRQINSKATAHLYWQLRQGLIRNTVHPYKASDVISQAIANGHEPPECNRKSRNHFRSLLAQYSQRGMHAHAMEEIKRCIARGHIDEYSLITPIANEYLTSLIEPRILRGTMTPQSRILALKKATICILQLAEENELYRVKPAVIERLIETMFQPIHRTQCNAEELFDVAHKHGVKMSVKAWNIKLQCVLRTKGAAARVVQLLEEMKDFGVAYDRYTIATALKGLRGHSAYVHIAEELISTAKRRGHFNHVIALEELKQLKDQERFQSLLSTFAGYYGDETLVRLGFLPISNDVAAITALDPRPAVSKEVISLVLDSLVRINPSPEQIHQLYQAYSKMTSENEHLQDDVYAQSIFIKAFSKHVETMVEALKMLETMRQGSNKPTVVTYTSVLEGLIKHGTMEMASAVLDQMRLDGLTPTALTWHGLIRGSLLTADMQSARQHYAQMQIVNCEPLPETQQLLIGLT